MKYLKRFLISFLFLQTISCASFVQPIKVKYLVPEDFRGGVILIYNQSDGFVPEILEDGTIVYRVPKDGFIKVKQPFKNEPYNFSYFFVNAGGDQTPIEYLYSKHFVMASRDTTSKSFSTISEDEFNNKVFAMIHTNENVGSGENKIYLQNFMIGKPKEYDLFYIQSSRKITDILVNNLKSSK